LLAALVLAGCGGDDQRPRAPLHVLAASSLTEAFTTIAGRYERDHPSTDVRLSFGGSSALVRQLHEGAPGDVLATADADTMTSAVAGGDAAAPQPFAGNALEIAVPPGNPPGVKSLADLDADLVIALAAPTVPAGKYAVEAFGRAGVPVPEASQEPDVRAVLTKVELNEVDAGIVYATDVLAARGRVTGVVIPPEHNVVATYLVARASRTRYRAEADRFIAAVRSPAGQKVLTERGFTVG
jgi:molybdate transport system substrate-binding protein